MHSNFGFCKFKSNAKENTTRTSNKKVQPVKYRRPAPKDIQDIVKDFYKKEGAHLETSLVKTIILCL